VRTDFCAAMEALDALRKALPDYGDDDTLEYMASVVADSDGDDLEENLAECVCVCVCVCVGSACGQCV